MIKSRVLAAIAVLAVVVSGAPLVRSQQNGKLTTQDYIDIQQLYARYNMSIDTGDGEAWAGTFTP